MDHSHVFFFLFQPIRNVIDEERNEGERRRLVVGKGEAGDRIELARGVLVLATGAEVVDPVRGRVFLIQEFNNLE